MLGGGTQQQILDNRIMQVSQNQEQSGANKKPAILFDLSLRYLNRDDWHKYCIPSDSVLKKQQNAIATASSSSPQAQSNECNEWKYLPYYSYSNEDEQIKLIRYLLRKIISFMKVEHVYNMFLLYEKETNFLNLMKNQGNGKTQQLKQSCGLEDISKKSLGELFLSPDHRKKKCIPSPMMANMQLEIKNVNSGSSQVQSVSSSQTQLTKDIVSKRGSLRGRISYALYDYWGQPIKNQSSNTKPTIFTFKTGHGYLLESKYFEQLLKLSESRELRWENFKNL
ncbi:hypothetical protein [Mycoplasma suis]|uniref:Uncharacterized protein n=2 Tax=Mycoplasma suis TaxID=57372 RepID=F0QRE1_MYCSL|nr:hypothetical protein MSU_0527 [Mycoplasma suis str. Illinois]